jgi:hypothetical protein
MNKEEVEFEPYLCTLITELIKSQRTTNEKLTELNENIKELKRIVDSRTYSNRAF